MSSSTPKDNQDWESFRFPSRPSLAVEDEEGDDEGRADDGEGGDDEGMPELTPRQGIWEYCQASHSIKSIGLNKQIRLSEIDQVQKIVRLLAVLDERTNYDVDSLIEALEAASQDCYGQDLGQVLADHRWGARMEWKPLIYMDISADEAVSLGRLRSRHSMG